MREDIIHGEILPDGTIKITTDPISAANHRSADELLEAVGKLAGGKIEREKRPHKHTHQHQHGHVHHKH